jgi:hypothetical protein
VHVLVDHAKTEIAVHRDDKLRKRHWGLFKSQANPFAIRFSESTK